MDELRATVDDVRHAYRLFLCREPDTDGLRHFVERIAAEGLSTRQLAKSFLGSAEFLRLHAPAIESPPTPQPAPPLRSQACTLAALQSPNFAYWTHRLSADAPRPHRKVWEWCYIAQALFERGCLQDTSRGLGFAVGTEPLSALFASLGCRITATDLDLDQASAAGWTSTHEHASDASMLDERGICPPDALAQNVRLLNVDMRDVPEDLVDFDFAWSSCAIEHLGSLDAAMAFVERSMDCLKPGGIAVHTTEYNVESDERTIEVGKDVIFRRRDLLELRRRLERKGFLVADYEFGTGDSVADRFVDEPPYDGPAHLKLRIGGFASTSFGLIVGKASTS
jgi:SAM-dependent methyltransferase